MTKRLRVLLIDDDPDFHRVFQLGLDQVGMTASSAFDGPTGISAARVQSPDAIVVDGVMPGTSGVEVCRSLRALPALEATVLVYLSAYAARGETAQSLSSLGVELVLAKPIDPRVLAAKIQRAVAQRAARALTGGTDFAQAMVELQADYLANAPSKVAALYEALDKADVPTVGPGELARLAHRLAGTAGSYGFPRAGELAARLEATCEGTPRLEPAALAEARALLDQIAHELRGPSRPPGSSLLRPETGASPVVRERLLLIDDDDDLRRRLELEAQRSGVHLSCFATEEDARAAIEAARPDCVFVDVHLGEDSGHDVIRRLRRSPGGDGLPIVTISGDESLANRMGSVEAGADAYLPKPVRLSDLVGAAARLLGRPRHGSRKVLLFGDATLGADLAGELSEHSVEVVTCTDSTRLVELLLRELPDLVLLSATADALGGEPLCRLLRADARFDDLPLVVLALGLEPNERVDLFRAGADDYLALPLVKEELVARVVSRLERSERIRALASRDALTGLFNRRYLDQHLPRELAVAERSGSSLAVVLFDVDHFKRVNDRFGHSAGDTVLRELAGELVSRLRRTDICCRYGGEEFVVMMRDVDERTCQMLVDRLRQAFARRTWAFGGRGFSVTLSAGIALYPIDASSPEALLVAADRALYAAKDDGRDRSVVTSSLRPVRG